jgi:hypothetical protein
LPFVRPAYVLLAGVGGNILDFFFFIKKIEQQLSKVRPAYVLLALIDGCSI